MTLVHSGASAVMPTCDVVLSRLPTNDPTNPAHRLADDLQRGRFKDAAVATDLAWTLAMCDHLSGWRSILSAPKDGTAFEARCGEFRPFECEWDGLHFIHYDPEEGPVAYGPDLWRPYRPTTAIKGPSVGTGGEAEREPKNPPANGDSQ